MATECTQDAIVRFLTVRGGRVRNKDLLEHFKAVFPPDSNPGERATVRETFKGYVDTVAFVKSDENAVKWVCLKKKYRRLIVKDDEASIGTAGAGAAGTEGAVPVLGQSQEGTGPDVQKDVSRCENEGTPQQQQQPCATEARTERTKERTGEESATSDETHHHQYHLLHAEVSPAGSGYGNEKQARRGETQISCGTILVDNRNEEKVDCQQQQQVPVIAAEEGVANSARESVVVDDMGNMGFQCEKSSGESVQANREPAPDIPQIAIIEASPLPAAADGSMFDLPGLYHHSGTGHDVQSDGTTSKQGLSRRRNSTGSQHSLRSGHPSGDDDESGSDDNASTPRGSRQNFIELMMNNSPQVRRSMANRNSSHLSRCNKDSWRSEGDSSSLASSSVAGEEDRAPVALDPLEHAWMMCASDGEWAGLQDLLADEPGLLLRRDFVTGFTCLHWAAKHGRAELLALVVNFARQHAVPIDVDVRSGAGGYTPLHLAAMHGHADVLKLLVGAYGADVEARDYSGKKACQYLTDNNATIDLRDIAGASATGGEQDAANGATAPGARRRLSNVLYRSDVLHPMRLLHQHNHRDDGDDQGGYDGSENWATDGQRRSKPVRRKSSLSDKMRPKLQRLRDRTSKIIHSVSFHDAEDLRATRRGSFKSSRPKSNLLG